MEDWKEEYGDRYTGILTGCSFPLDDPTAPVGVAVDNDIGIAEASAETDLAWRLRFGDGSMRIGRWPRWLRQCRAPNGIHYVKGVAIFVKLNAETGEMAVGADGKPLMQKVELLGRGQQFAASAFHPKAKARYLWLAGDGSGDTVRRPTPLADTPEITPDELASFILEDVSPIMERHGWTLLSNTVGQTFDHRIDGRTRDGEGEIVARKQGDEGEWHSTYTIATDSEEHVRRYLTAQDAAADQGIVFANLAALYDWDNDPVGYAVALEWLQSSEGHTNVEAGIYLRQQWRFLERNRRREVDIGPRRTIGHLKTEYKHAQAAAGNPESLSIRQRLETQLGNAESYEEFRTEVVPAVRDEIVNAGDTMTKEDLESLAQTAKLKANGKVDQGGFGLKTKLGEWQMQLIPADTPPPKVVAMGLADKLYEEYVYRESNERYIDLNTGTDISRTTLNNRLSAVMPPRLWRVPNGLRHKADEVLAGGLFGFRVMRRIVGTYYEVEGDPLRHTALGWEANQYKPGSFPVVDRPFDMSDPEDAEMADMIYRHLRLISDDDPATATALLQNLAYRRQHPNKRIYWAVGLLSETQGNGKNFYETLCKAGLGDAQVATMAPRDMNDLGNPYVSRAVLMTFLQEPEAVPARSRNRFNAADLKDTITADEVSVRRMRNDPVPERVYTQIVVLSNYEGVLGKEAAGRRWLAVNIRARSEQEIVEILGTTPKEFYHRYGHALSERGGRAAAYLETVDLEGFDSRRVPETRHKAMHTSASPLETMRGLIREYIAEDKHHDIGPDVLNWRAVRCQINIEASRLFEPIDGGEDELGVGVLMKMPPKRLLSLFRDAATLEGFVQLSHEDRNVKLPFEIADTVKANTVWFRRDIIEWDENRRPRLHETALLALLRQTLDAHQQTRQERRREERTQAESRSISGLH